ncbi:hypothetical protein LQW54_010583 [Pestalotiopsis sp. IQ-011]
MKCTVLLGVLSTLAHHASAIDLDITQPGNNTGDVPGNLPDPYYWWQAGAMFGSLLDYWSYTGDESYNNITYQAMWHQRGDDYDYMPDNQTRSLGNDDQGFWALTSMSAAELNFTNPPDDEPGWLGLTQAVFNEYVERWNEAEGTCGGGLRWQIFTFNNGYNYKNSISNGCFFNIASRLARYTGNDTYREWADKIFDWELGVGFINDAWEVRDGAGNAGTANCTEINGALFSYNAGIFLHGAAYMYNLTETDTWKNRVESLTNSIATTFFTDGIMWELPCEATATSCNNDQRMFKGFLSRWMAGAVKMAPALIYDTVMPLLQTTAVAVAEHCVSHTSDFKGHAGTACTFSWYDDSTYEDSTGVGEQMNAMSVMYTMLIDDSIVPYTTTTGGSSSANIDGGASSSSKYQYLRDITTADKVGAGIVTTLIMGCLVAALVFMNLD